MTTPKSPPDTLLGFSEEELLKASDPLLSTQKFAMLGIIETIKKLNESMTNTISISLIVNTDMLKFYVQALDKYLYSFETLVQEYDKRVQMPSDQPPITAEERKNLSSAENLFSKNPKPKKPDGDNGPSGSSGSGNFN